MSEINHNVCPIVDFANTRIRLLIGENVNNQISLLANVSVKNEGIREGKIVDMPTVIEALKMAIKEAEKESGYQIHSVNASIDALQTKTAILANSMAIPSGEVKQKDMDFLISSIQKQITDRGYAPVHFLLQYFCINPNTPNQSIVKNPVGMMANSLSASFCAIYTDRIIHKNFKTAVRRAGVNLNSLIVSPLATAYAVSSEKERNNEVFVLDIGYETSNYFWFKQGMPYKCGGFSYAGKDITNRIAAAFRLSPDLALKLKLQYGDVSSEYNNYEINTESLVSPTINSSALSEVLKQSYRHLFEKELALVLQARIPTDIILTGGGSMVSGLSDLLSNYYYANPRIEYFDPNGRQEDLGLVSAYGMLKLRYSAIKDFSEIREQGFFSLGQSLTKFMEI